MRRKHLLALVPLVVAVPLVAGCGGQSSVSTKQKLNGEEKNIQNVIGNIQSASQNADGSKLCSQYFAPGLVKQIEVGGAKCADKVKKSLNDADDFTGEVLKITVKGKTAQALIRRSGDSKAPISTFIFAKQRGGKWKVQSFKGPSK
jgi:hypothetical protein